MPLTTWSDIGRHRERKMSKIQTGSGNNRCRATSDHVVCGISESGVVEIIGVAVWIALITCLEKLLCSFIRKWPIFVVFFRFRPPCWPKNITSGQTFYVMRCGHHPSVECWKPHASISKDLDNIDDHRRRWLLEAPLGRPRNQNQLGRASVKMIIPPIN